MKKTLFIAVLLTLIIGTARAGIPDGYYDKANGLYGASLKTALYGIINSHTSVGYSGLWSAYKTTDVRSDGKIWDIYSNTTNYTPGTDQNSGSYKAEGDNYNREHTFCQSWFEDASSAGTMKADVFHVYPTDSYVNGMRSNYPFGTVSSATYSSNNSFSKLGTSSVSGYTGTVFEPNDEYKGDIARSLFYMVTCYQGDMTSCSSAMLSSDTYPSLSSWAITMLLQWAKDDPVSDKEKARQEAIYALQGNRNPYIDYPGLEQYVWGDYKTTSVDLDNYTNPNDGTTTTTVATPVFSPTAGTYSSAQSVTITCSTSGATIYYTTDGTTPTSSSTKYTGAITVSETTTIKAIAILDGTSSSVASATYTISSTSGGSTTTGNGDYVLITSTSDIEDGASYLIVYETGTLILDGSLTTLDAEGNYQSVTISDHTISAAEGDPYNFTITKSGSDYIITSKSGYSIGSTADKNQLLYSTSTTYTNSISFDGDDVLIAGTKGTILRYNANTSNGMRFRYYKSSSYTNQQAIQLYKKTSSSAETVDVTIGESGYGTLYYGEKNLIVPSGVSATTYVVNNGTLSSTLTYDEGDIIPCATGVVLEGSAATYTFTVTTDAGVQPTSNMLRGSDTDSITTGGTLYYQLSLDANETACSIGFYYGADNGGAFTNKAHKAYLAVSSSSNAKAAYPLNGTTGIATIDVEDSTTPVIYTISGIRMNGDANQLPKGIYIVNGKKVVIK